MRIKYSKEFLTRISFLNCEIERLESVEIKSLDKKRKIEIALLKLREKLKSFREGYKLAAKERDPQDKIKTKVKKSLNSSNAYLYYEEKGCKGKEGEIGKMPKV